MLISLRIENFALIDHLDLDLGPGLNVFTGETGAGKSIILDALDVVLGGKVERRMIRSGETKAMIEATFELTSEVIGWLVTQEIEPIDDALLVCSREISLVSQNLRSRSRLNGTLVNRKLIDTLRERLLEITAQGQTLQIVDPQIQRTWLDQFGGAEIERQLVIVSKTYQQAMDALHTLENRRQSEQQRLQRIDLLKYQGQELAQAQLKDGDELESLEQERQRLSHVVELQQKSYEAYQLLYQSDHEGQPVVADLLADVEAIVTDMVSYDEQLQPVLHLVAEALVQVMEAGQQIHHYGENLEADPVRLQEVAERSQELKRICRKYGPTLTEAIAYYDSIRQELAELESEGQSIESLEIAYQQLQGELAKYCGKLTSLRKKAANQLETLLIQALKPLAMERVQFQVAISPIDPGNYGADQITFTFSANPGEPLQPLGNIASGGEMSRFLLAMKSCFCQIEKPSTLVFDEIDVGVSGRVASTIAEKLHELSQSQQLLCVTHQPIIAAMADQHFRVDKQIIDAGLPKKNKKNSRSTASITDDPMRAVVRVTPLSHPQRQTELAQLASGQPAEEAIAFAASLLAQANSRRHN